MKVEKREKTGGRKKGTPNSITTEIRTSFANLVNDNIQQIEDDLKTLTAYNRLRILVEMSKLILPKVVNEADEWREQPLFNIINLGEGKEPTE